MSQYEAQNMKPREKSYEKKHGEMKRETVKKYLEEHLARRKALRVRGRTFIHMFFNTWGIYVMRTEKAEMLWDTSETMHFRNPCPHSAQNRKRKN